jgi:hypothetical protein
MPYVPVSIGYRGAYTREYFQFLVDSGAMYSFAPKGSISEIVDGVDDMEEVDTPCKDAHGRRLRGTQLSVTLLINGLPPIVEDVWFSTQFNLWMLGQTFFTNYEVCFRNFYPNYEFEFGQRRVPSPVAIVEAPVR